MLIDTGPITGALISRGSAPNKKKSALLGADPWPYSIAQNRVVLDTLLDYAFEQGLTDRRLEIKEIFTPSTLD